MASRSKLLTVVVLGGLGLLAARAASLSPLRKKAFPNHARPLAFAHRGGSALWPENTLQAFEGAAEMGALVLELDVHLTRDGEVVVHHDPRVDRTSDGEGAIAELTLAELRELDFGARFPFPEGAFRGPFEIATLGTIFERFPAHAVNIDVKVGGTDCAEATARVIMAAGADDRVLVTSFLREPIHHIRDHYPAIATGVTRGEIQALYVLGRLGLERLIRPRGLAYQVPVHYGGREVVTRSFVDAAHNLGQEVHVWTIDDQDEMRRLLELGVDGLMTDRPDILLEVLAERAKE